MTTLDLDVFHAACARPWRRGVNDCFTVFADQVLAWFGIDPMARYRGRYTSQHGYLRVIRKDGYADPQDAFRGEMEKAGFVQVDDMHLDGDAALAAFLDGEQKTVAPALYLEGFWHIRAKTGWLALDGQTGILEVRRCL